MHIIEHSGQDHPATPLVGETRVDSATSLVQDLKTNHGVKDPKLILVFDSNGELHVFYNSPSERKVANLNVGTVSSPTPIMVGNEQEFIKTIYPGGNVGFCTKLGGKHVWIT